eukprot:CAMPEP_0198333074 /NCGR_PEP_ID=MMETSP1450-20131203/18708_1 /TAXON_ID=753684 ORGANISM="Madagascaria erythrocladiodes, Strain CCMP3234" /NCGR_SAMPLE_ID=MMETSP1450 /ASSEMBLY_ACC=CAM_ASM_001115 /LENGTH=440 /DNA_ID=CAMNT_0044037575 /DNA_START=119 /DNA_END=1441 /DNA_ORIENTATION=-
MDILAEIFSDPCAKHWLQRPSDPAESARLISPEMLDKSLCHSYSLAGHMVSGLLVPFAELNTGSRHLVLGFWLNRGLDSLTHTLFDQPPNDSSTVPATDISRFLLDMDTGRSYVADWIGESGLSVISVHHHCVDSGRFEIDVTFADIADEVPERALSQLRLKRDCPICQTYGVMCACTREMRLQSMGGIPSLRCGTWADFTSLLVAVNRESDSFTIEKIDPDSGRVISRLPTESTSVYRKPSGTLKSTVASFLLFTTQCPIGHGESLQLEEGVNQDQIVRDVSEIEINELIQPFTGDEDTSGELMGNVEVDSAAQAAIVSHDTVEAVRKTMIETDESAAGSSRKNHKTQYGCTFCSKVFYQKTHVTLHISTVHMGEKPHKCTVCGLRFGSVSNLRRHDRSVHQRIPRPKPKRADAQRNRRRTAVGSEASAEVVKSTILSF